MGRVPVHPIKLRAAWALHEGLKWRRLDACKAVGISIRSFERWGAENGKVMPRKGVAREVSNPVLPPPEPLPPFKPGPEPKVRKQKPQDVCDVCQVTRYRGMCGCVSIGTPEEIVAEVPMAQRKPRIRTHGGPISLPDVPLGSIPGPDEEGLGDDDLEEVL